MELKIENVTYGYVKTVNALSGITVDFGSGMHLLLGPNGAGKTTLLRLIAGLIRPQQGECVLGEVSTDSHSPHTVSEVFMLNDACVFPLNTINDMVRRHAPFYPQFCNGFLQEALAAFEMTGDERLSSLSLGNRHKAQLAYALALGTKVLLFDEPANGLDIASKKSLAILLNRAMAIDEDRCIIVATHTVQEMRYLFDTVTILDKGRIVLNATVPFITQRLAFITDPKRHDDALCYETSIEGPTQIIPNTDGIESSIDYTLLYMAATGPNADTLKSNLS